MKLRRTLCILLAVVMIASLFAACDTNSGSSTTAASTTKAAGTTAPATTAALADRPVLTMTSLDAGISYNDGFDFSDNPLINMVEDYAGVDLEVEIIPNQDYQTKANLLLASGQYPDILHTAYNENISDVEGKGAFINLLPYYENSAIVQSRIDYDSYITRMKNAVTGEYYALPMSNSGDGYPAGRWMRARWDLVEELNNSVWPTTLDEWVDLAKKVKEKNPNATPFSAWCPGTMIFQYNKQFWEAYGHDSNLEMRLDYDTGVFEFNVNMPTYKEAMKFHKMLYDEGLLSQTFATNTDYAMFGAEVDNNDVLVISDSIQQMDWIPASADEDFSPSGSKWLPAPLLSEYPVAREDAMRWNTKPSAFDSGHRVSISAKCEYPDLAWKVLEGLCTDEVYEYIFWGVEGEAYTVVNGERVVDPEVRASKDFGVYRIYASLLGYGHNRVPNFAAAKLKWADNPDKLARVDMYMDLAAQIGAESAPRDPEYSIDDLLSDEARTKTDEAQGVVTSLAVQFIMGRIDEATWDAKIAEFNETYGYMIEERTAAYQSRYMS